MCTSNNERARLDLLSSLTYLLRTLPSLLVLFFASQSLALAASYPNWAMQPIQMGQQHIVFAGTGESLEAARLDAIAALLSQLDSKVSSKQLLQLNKIDQHSSQAFQQNTNLETLVLELAGIEELKHYAKAGRYAIQLSLSRNSLEQSLLQPIITQSSVQPPHGQRKDLVVWALQAKPAVTRAQRLERALAATGYDSSKYRTQLQQQAVLAEQTLQTAGIKIIYSYDEQELAAQLSQHFPSAGKEQFWLKVQQRKQVATAGSEHLQRIQLFLELIEAQEPFTPYLSKQINVDGAGATQAAANQNSQQKLLNLISQDLDIWFFD